METSDSPWKVMEWAYATAARVLPDYASRFSRHDFTLAQLYACLVLREHMGLSYRATEVFLRDSGLVEKMGINQAPDHTTLCRAYQRIVTTTGAQRMLDLMFGVEPVRKMIGKRTAFDSTLCETHHRSRHYERRCRHYASSTKKAANTRRSRSAKRTPKLSIAVCVRSHLILAFKTRTGMGSDARDFEELLYRTCCRVDVKDALADAGFDSEHNHRVARKDLGVRSLIPATAGRPTAKPASTPYRRMMQRQLRGSQKGKPYGQRAQVETVMSMIKRNLGDSLRSRTTMGRRRDLVMKVLTHNLMILL